MTRSTIRSFSFAATLVVACAGNLGANDAPRLLNQVEVRQMVARGLASDHARLSTHFDLLQEQYASDALRHRQMVRATTFAKITEVAQAQHCRTLAARNEESAATLRGLAEHHERLAGGLPSTPPEGGAPFENGLGAPEALPSDLAVSANSAFTPSDHVVLSDYYSALALTFDRDADGHEAYARTWHGLVPRMPGAARTAAHCEQVAAELRGQAREASDAALMHRTLVAASR